MRSSKSKKVRQRNGQKIYQTLHTKTKDRATRTHLNTGDTSTKIQNNLQKYNTKQLSMNQSR